MIRKITAAFDKICGACLYVAIAFIIIAILTTFLQIMLRMFFSTALIWAEEFTRYIILAGMSLGIATTARLDRMPKVDIFIANASPRIRFYINYFVCITTMFVCTVIIWQGTKATISMRNMWALTLEIPMAVPYVFMPISGLLMFSSAVVRLLNNKMEG
jgi:TRAP-type C4-dicarboxylate transport system permease small subunit